MASTASGSQPPPLASTSNSTVEQRSQAEPLPAKVGEIGYLDISDRSRVLQDVDLGDGPDVDDAEGLTAAEADARNGRHPADRSHVNLTSTSSASLPILGTDQHNQRNTSNSNTSVNSTSKRSIFSLHSFSAKVYKGITLRTLTRLGALIFALCALIVAWVFAAMRLKSPASTWPPKVENVGGGSTSTIFIHVAFAVIILILLILLERNVFQLRAERYAHLHPGEILPSHRHGMGASPGGTGSAMALAPWNRPPLPTYAAALGMRGTGDVEDNIIAVPPPPQYGNTRGSTLLLSSYLRRSGMSHRSRASDNGEDAWHLVEHPGGNNRISDVSARSMPISYNEVELQNDVERARILEQTLARLEDAQDSGRPSADART